MLTEYNIPLRKNLDTGKNVQYLDKKRSEYKGTVPPVSLYITIILYYAHTMHNMTIWKPLHYFF